MSLVNAVDQQKERERELESLPLVGWSGWPEFSLIQFSFNSHSILIRFSFSSYLVLIRFLFGSHLVLIQSRSRLSTVVCAHSSNRRQRFVLRNSRKARSKGLH